MRRQIREPFTELPLRVARRLQHGLREPIAERTLWRRWWWRYRLRRGERCKCLAQFAGHRVASSRRGHARPVELSERPAQSSRQPLFGSRGEIASARHRLEAFAHLTLPVLPCSPSAHRRSSGRSCRQRGPSSLSPHTKSSTSGYAHHCRGRVTPRSARYRARDWARV